MPKFYNLIYVNDLKSYEKGQGVPHHKNFSTIKLGTIIGFNESDAADKADDMHVPFGCDVLTIPADAADSNYQHTMKADGASEVNKHPCFLDPGTHMVTKLVDIASKTLVDNGNPMPPIPSSLKFMNPQMTPQRRI